MESVAYYTHSSQDREYMSCHGGATRGIIKSEVAKSVSEREELCVQVFSVVLAGSTREKE